MKKPINVLLQTTIDTLEISERRLDRSVRDIEIGGDGDGSEQYAHHPSKIEEASRTIH